MNRGVASIWCWLLAILVGPAIGQPVTEKAFLEELPVVLSASRIPQSLSMTPGAVTVLDREFIRATGYRDIPSLLKLVPGFQVATERGGYAHVTYHGLGHAFPNRMQVLIDGRSVYSPYHLGGVDWFAVPLTIDEIERIEAFRGSNSASYGSNAFMGVVNIITRDAGDRPGTELGVAAGNNRIADLSFSHERRQGDLGLRANVEVRHDQGLPALVDLTRKSIVTLRADYQLGTRDEVVLGLGVNDSRRELGFTGTPYNGNGLRPTQGLSTFAHLRWHRALGAGEDLQLGYYHNEDRGRDAYSAYLPALPPLLPVASAIPIDFDRKARRDNLDFQHRLSPTENTRAAWGLELRRDAVQSRRIFYSTSAVKQQLGRAFGSLEWQAAPALTLNAGAMVERYSGDRTRIAPRLFANWRVAPGHTLRAGRSVAYRAPSLAEEKADIRVYSGGYSGLILLSNTYVGTGSVRPERIAANEIGYLAQFARWNAVFDLRIYREEITDLVQEIRIFPAPSAAELAALAYCRALPAYTPPQPLILPGLSVSSFCNSSQPARNTGFEWSLDAKPFEGTQLKLNYSHLKLRSPFAVGHEREAPRHVVNLTWMQDWGGKWSSTLTATHYSPYEWGSGSHDVTRYTSYDARLAYRFGWSANPVEAALVLRNFGPRHQEFLPPAVFPSNFMPRTAMVSLRFAL